MNSLVLLLLAAPTVNLPELPPGECFTTPFVQTRDLPALQRPLVLNGVLRMERDAPAWALTWEITAPYHYRFSARDGRFTETLPDGSQRDIDSAQAPWLAGVQQLFSALLAGRDDTLSDWFEIAGVEQTGDGQRLSLQPVSEAVARVVGGLTVTYGEHLQGVTIAESGGGTTTLRFEPLRTCDSDRPQ